MDEFPRFPKENSGLSSVKSKLFVGLLVLLNILLAVTVFFLARRQFGSESTAEAIVDNVCLTEGCVREANLMMSRMNFQASPCDDFYEFSCGRFVMEQKLDDDTASITIFGLIRKKRDGKLRWALEEEVKPTDSDTIKMVKDFYASCMDVDRINSLGMAPLLEMITEYGGWPILDGDSWNGGNFSWLQMVQDSRQKGLDDVVFSSLFDIDVVPDSKNTSISVLKFDEPRLVLNREFLVNGTNDPVMQEYLMYMIEVGVYLGANRSTVEEEMKEVVDLEIAIAKMCHTKEQRRNITNLYNPMNLSDFSTIFPIIDWENHVNSLLPGNLTVDGSEKIVVYNPSYFKNWTELMLSISPRVLANYMMWRLTYSISRFLDFDFKQLKLPLLDSMYGTKAYDPRWVECIDETRRKMSLAISHIYVKNYFDHEAKELANDLILSLMEEFKDVLLKVEWMDNSTRGEALDKLEKTTPQIAYPPELTDEEMVFSKYAGIPIQRKSYIDNILGFQKHNDDYSMNQLRKSDAKYDWVWFGASAITVNAYADYEQNSIQFPAGILQGQFFEKDRPNYMNYGGIGKVIGHEISHLFDDEGKTRDSNGNYRNWWQPETEKQFRQKAHCFVEQYSNFSINGMQLNGEAAAGENIADNGGVSQSYYAYHKWVEKNGVEQTLPGMQKLTPNQLFWISSAQKHCSKYSPEMLKTAIISWYHNPWKFRLLGSLQNIEEFSRDWECPVGSPMNPEHKCKLW